MSEVFRVYQFETKVNNYKNNLISSCSRFSYILRKDLPKKVFCHNSCNSSYK